MPVQLLGTRYVISPAAKNEIQEAFRGFLTPPLHQYYFISWLSQVEELSASAADKKQAKTTSDPLDQYCDDNPEADECR